ncbi:unnamed protein product [Didymodactylos carnosus]|uniref:B-related factor 1 n=1 Tax=Didymodactylos carnosus TaxID=1234261 RepID=A0A813X2K1_9BILA|nr:unnamed protein product [Didymodactylos carnosus]CAF0883715.1 unnamed protein product [Didymodactylos carnosus]CAF3653089.1 unnamed protein product [Didymodactylos carnosus]CAF3667040.1 unnamed protein product [Didymodactylos carnosus]
MSSKVCKCGCSEIDTDRAQGVSVCTRCGEVIEDSLIVNETEVQDIGGGLHIIGSWVGSDDVRAASTGMMGYANIRESRQITLHKARRGLMDISSNMHMNQHCTDAAFKIYKMALDRGLSKGNKSSHLLASCLYIICRTEGTQHILLDFCDLVEADISVLGRIYMRLARELCINVPHTDPSLLIPRYAAKLDFGDKTNAVSNTASRIVQRMKRDWLAIGRRSSGLCGSALLFAARMHNFNRTIQEIVDVVKISKATIMRRLQEFENTPTAQLSIDEFQTIELEEEQDPPAFVKSKKTTKLTQQDEMINIEMIEKEIIETQKEIDEQLEKLRKPRGWLAKFSKFQELEKTVLMTEEDDLIKKVLSNSKLRGRKRKDTSSINEEDEQDQLADETLEEVADIPLNENDSKWAQDYLEQEQTKLILLLLKDDEEKKIDGEDTTTVETEDNNNKDLFKLLRPTLETLGIDNSSSQPNCESTIDISSAPKTPVTTNANCDVVLDFPEWQPSIDLTQDELDITGIDDSEIDDMILTRDETKLKLKSWLRENKNWFLEEKRRERNKELLEQKQNSALGGLSHKKKRKKKTTNDHKTTSTMVDNQQIAGYNSMTPAGAAAAAIAALEAEKTATDKRSSKINYDVLKRLASKKEMSKMEVS